MPFYNDPITEEYFIPSAAFGATTDATRIVGPKGRKGYVSDIMVDVTASMVGTTTVPEIVVGATSGSSEYARFRLGTSATAGYAATAVFRASQVGGNTLVDGSPVYEDYTGHVKMSTAAIPADTQIFITRVAGTGGSPAGTGTTRVTIDWF
ncbi:MAG TPA: hypothetical protein PKI32_05870 [Opitutales bacterium]|nr:hypothetical protein [Opitutales bacterium]